MEKYQCDACSCAYTGKFGRSSLIKHQKQKHCLLRSLICECGYTATCSQALNGHYSYCVEHRIAIGKIGVKRSSPNKDKPSPHKGKKLEEILLKPETLDEVKARKSAAGKAEQAKNPRTHTDETKRICRI